MVRYFIEQPSPSKRYALEFLLRTCGYSQREVSTPRDADLYYGNAPASSRAVVIPDRSAGVCCCDVIAGDEVRNPCPSILCTAPLRY